MQFIPNYIDELIASCLAKNARSEEQQSLDEWINSSEENHRYYEQMKFIFDTSTQEKRNELVDVNSAWDKIKPQIKSESIRIVHMNPSSKKGMSFYKIAATVVLICVVASLAYYFIPFEPNQNELLSVLTEEKSVEQKLPDGSIVTVNPNSSFVALHKAKREYRLAGDAYFDVKHDDKNPFIIHVNNLCIKDIGTSFSVEGNPKENLIRVNVTEGTVQLYTHDQKGVTLNKGESGTYNKSLDVFEKIENLGSKNEQTFNLSFDNAKLEDVALTLQNKFNTKIVFANEKIKKCSISVKFDESNLKEILEVITETLDLWSTNENGIITLGGDGCGE